MNHRALNEITRVTCTKCSWISFPVTKAHAEAKVKEFNDYYDSQPPETQSLFGGPSSVDRYVCLRCGGSDCFRPSTDEEVAKIYGSTINPVIWEK